MYLTSHHSHAHSVLIVCANIFFFLFAKFAKIISIYTLLQVYLKYTVYLHIIRTNGSTQLL